MDDEGHYIEDEAALKDLGQSHFANIYKDDNQTCLLEQLKVVLLYPNMISHVDAPCLIQPVTLSEVESALHSFKKDRSPSPNGWLANLIFTSLTCWMKNYCLQWIVLGFRAIFLPL